MPRPAAIITRGRESRWADAEAISDMDEDIGPRAPSDNKSHRRLKRIGTVRLTCGAATSRGGRRERLSAVQERKRLLIEGCGTRAAGDPTVDDAALPIEAEEHLRNTLLATRLRRWRVTLVALQKGDNARCPGWDDVGGFGRRSSHGRGGRNCRPLQRRCLRRRGYGCRRPRLLLLRFLFHLLRRFHREIRAGSGVYVGWGRFSLPVC